MQLADFNRFCSGLPQTTTVVQWGGSHVWKVGGKVFAIGWPEQGKPLAVTFKASPMSFDLLKDKPGVRPAPYLASRGMSWLQRTDAATMSDADLRAYLQESHRLVAAGLPKRSRQLLGFNAS